MSSANALADAGVKAVTDGQYALGITKLTEALKAHAAPLWYLERSKAYLRTNELGPALRDAETALHIAFGRANRDHMTEAQLRRAVTLYRMGRFADADVCAFWAIRLIDGAKARDDGNQQDMADIDGNYTVQLKQVQEEARPQRGDGLATALNTASKRTKEASLRNQALTWRIQALTQMEKLPAGHDGRKLHDPIQYPVPPKEPTPSPSNSEPTSSIADNVGGGETSGTPNATPNRDAWEKTDTSLTIDIFLKNLSQEQVTIDANPQVIRIRPVGDTSFAGFGSSIILLLFDDIKPDAVKYTVKSMKIELVLQKETAGKWPVLRRRNADIMDNLSEAPHSGIPFERFFYFVTHLGYNAPEDLALPDADSDPSAWYVALLGKFRFDLGDEPSPLSVSKPTASIPPSPGLSTAVEDTANIEGSAEKATTEATQALGQGNTAPKANDSAPSYPTSSKRGPIDWDKIDSVDDEAPFNDSDPNDFFLQIYKNSDEDGKRAMMKSFVESNGTALSTNWTDVKDKTYKTHPPEGVEAKKWE
ncbi:hypothetical protein GQX73_g2198 [Xylaria multiplex]|uniref:CS domain-containing protein n=1 Tax=Xylaria multiplex TaxID=323545 RepID=A0A7C8MQS0_9PEZI|nr:hypothetical protein GQX73_g2198 [Xylaria multiplex]